MPSVQFMFRSHDPDGTPRATAQMLVQALGTDPHLGALAESVHGTIARESGESHLVLSVEQEPPVAVDFAPLGPHLAVAHLTRAQTAAVLMLVSAAHSRLVAPDLAQLQSKLAQSYPQARFPPLFAWVLQTRPPLATAIYLNSNEPDTGIDTVIVAVAAAFFRLRQER